MESKEVAEIEYVEPSFMSHEFTYSSSITDVKFEILKMKDSTFIWIGETKKPCLSDLSYGIKSPVVPHPIATQILGTASADTPSQMMAERLTKKLNKPVFVTFSIPLSNFKLQEEIEKRLHEEITLNKDKF